MKTEKCLKSANHVAAEAPWVKQLNPSQLEQLKSLVAHHGFSVAAGDMLRNTFWALAPSAQEPLQRHPYGSYNRTLRTSVEPMGDQSDSV
jgi:hypothetical protein